MTISLQNIQPAFLKINSSDASQIWNKPVKFNKGEHLHIVAPSGKGKTSLIHFLYGLRKDYTGEIFYNNEMGFHFSLIYFFSVKLFLDICRILLQNTADP